MGGQMRKCLFICGQAMTDSLTTGHTACRVSGQEAGIRSGTQFCAPFREYKGVRSLIN